ncbi:hypothetical protein SSTU70S_04571 [Stutzerimonas stutzeri]
MAPGIAVEQGQRLLRVLAGEAAQADGDHVGHGRMAAGKTLGLAQHLRLLRDLDEQLAVAAQARQVLAEEAGESVVAGLHRELGAFPAAFLGEPALGGPLREQHIAGFGLRFADQPEALGGGIAFGQAAAELILAEQAVQLGEVQLRIVVLEERGPVAARCQKTQPAQFHPADLRQVAVFGKKFLDFRGARGLESGGQLVVGQVRFQRIVAQCAGVAPVRRAVALGEGALGFIVKLALLGQASGRDIHGQR